MNYKSENKKWTELKIGKGEKEESRRARSILSTSVICKGIYNIYIFHPPPGK